MDISDEQYKALIDQVSAMEAMLADLKAAVRALQPIEPKPMGAMERTTKAKATKAKAAFQEALTKPVEPSKDYLKQPVREPPDLYDAWRMGDELSDSSDSSDPNAQFYESENAEIKAEQVPQKGKVKLLKSRKAAPEYD